MLKHVVAEGNKDLFSTNAPGSVAAVEESICEVCPKEHFICFVTPFYVSVGTNFAVELVKC